MLASNEDFLDDGEQSSDATRAYASAKATIVSKLCNFGMVTSKKWISTYLTILDGCVRLYDSQQSCVNNPKSFALEITLGKNHRASEITKKNYSQNKMEIIDFYCFYVEIDNGIFSPSKLLKIGSLDQRVAKSIVDCITLHSRSYRI
jgi:hypothetical protein